MLSRISDALGCCDKDSSSDYEPEGSSWLSTSVEVTPFFVVPAQTLQDILQKVGISRCPNTGQFYLTKIPFLAVSNHVSNPNSPWAMAYSAQKRCRYLETFLKSKHQLCHKLTGELRSLSAISDENISGNLSTFFSLLCPLLTDTPNAEFERSDNDVLMLFGSPATAFQILLYTPCLCSFLTDFVLELVANRSPYSEHLLEQFRQPIGLHALFGTKQTFSDISSRLTDLFQIAEEPRVQAKILGILPDLASSPCSSGCILTDEDRSSLVSQLINLLDNVSLENQHTSPKDCNAVICLIECLTNFSVKGNLTDRLHSAFFQLLDRCNGLDFYFEYLRIITRCLLISGPALPQTPTELSKLVTRLRTYFMFARSDFVDSAAVINSTLVDLLRVAFQFNKNIVSEWIRVIGLDSQTCDLTCQTTNDFRPHNQSFQDFIILCIALSTPTMTVHKSGDNLDVASDASMEALCSSDSYKYNRLKSEVLSSVRRLLITGRLFSLDRIHNDIDTFLANYGELLVSGSTRLFSPFTIILNQLITSNDLVPSRFKFVTRYIALSLYIKTFTSCMSDHLQKQEIVSHLVHHSLMGINNLIVKSTGRSKLEGIIDATLVTLIRLAQSSARELGVFETNLRALRNQVDFTGSCCDPKQTNSKDSNVVNGHHSGYLHQKKHIKHIFFILAYTAFGIREHHEQQDSLLLFVRKLLSSQSLFSKCVGIIGAVVIIEVICRRDSSLKNVERNPATCLSLNEDDSAVLASQLAHLDSGRSSTYTTNTSRSSNASSLSLKVPGTELADDPCDVHLSVVDSEEDTGANCSSHSSHLITPSRLLLRLIGLVEYSVRSYCQLMVFWLEELAFCFNRLTQLGDKSRTSQSVLDHGSINESPFYGEGKKLVIWMGARIMRHFQDDFVLDNASLQNHLPQFSLHKPSLCEVAVALGPSWDRCSANQRLLKGASLENSFTSSPLLLPAYLNLIAIVEADQNNGNLNTIDALLGCPVLMPNIFLNSKATQLIMANEPVSIEEPYLVIGTINWFIETVNVFASKLLLANSSSSQNFHSQTVASTDVSNSTRTHYLSILLRLIQIAKLRHCLYYYVVMALRMKDVQQPDAVEISDIENPGFQSHRMPTDSEYSVSSSNLFFPTATYQPAMCFSNHFASCNKEVNHVWFNCGVRLQSFLSGDIDCSSGRKRKGSSSRFGACSKGKETLVSSNVSMVKRRKVLDNTIESQWENVNENEDDNLSEMSDSAVSQDESNTIQQSDSPQTSRKHDKKTVFVKSSKMAKVSRKAIKSDKRCVMPSLRELTTCFRELDLNAIVLGLSSWPWVVKCSDDHVSNVSSIDWTTLTWLLDELSIRLDYVIGVPLPATDGWDAFGRLNNLTESSKLAYFTYIVPYLVYILVHAVDYIPGIANHANYSKNNVGNTVFSSDSSNDEGGSQDITESEKSQSDAPTSEKSNPLNGSKFIESLSSGLSCQISSIVCICLRSLLIFINGFINLSPNVGRYLFDSPDSLAISSMTTFTYNTINTFAKCCKSNINTSAAREIVINAEGIIRPDHYKPINHDYDVEQATLFMKQIDEVDGKLFVDIYDENYDSLPVLKEISNVPRIDNAALSENLRTIIEYLMKNLTPSRLPNANAALLHCRLVFYLSSLYYECQNSLSVSCQSDENTFWIPDLFSYTKDVLNQEWEASIKLTDQTYSECLQALLSFHLRCQFYRSKKLCSLSQSTSLLVDFTRRALAPTVQYHQNTIHSLSSNGVSDNLNDSYRTLNQRTIDIFCREVLESVVWISKHLCDLARGIYTSVHLDESSIVAQWNQCVEVLCCITDFFRKSERITESNSKFSRNFPPDKSNSIIHLLPTVMRTGRLFLQLLLKGAMPLLNNLFRHRGVEVTTFLKNTQQLTRFLQRICNHAKTYRDSQLTNQIPATRRCLETFVYKVKVMLSQNRCLEAFWLGTLKNRDLHGTDLSEDNDSVESDTECLSTGSRSVSYSNSSRIDIDRNSATHCLSNTSTSTSNRIANEGQSIPGYTNGESEEVEEECEGSIEEEDVIDKSPSEDSDLIEANDDY